MPSKRLEEKRKCPPVLRNEWTRVKKTRKKSHIPTTTTPCQGGGCFDATRKKRTDRRNRRHDFPELKFVQDGGFTGGIETNLRAFFRALREESLRSVPTHIERGREKIPRNRRSNTFHPFKKPHATPRRGEAADVPPHRISQNSKTPRSLFVRSVPPSTTFTPARNSKSNPLPLHHHLHHHRRRRSI